MEVDDLILIGSVMSRSKRVRTPDEKLAGFRARAERAMAMSKS